MDPIGACEINVFIKIFKNIGKLEKESAIKPWIYRITKNTIIDYYKKKKEVSVSPETLHWIEDEIDDVDNMKIAETLGISVSASKVRLKRAKDMFKKKLLECCDFEVDKYGNIINYIKKEKCEDCDK